MAKKGRRKQDDSDEEQVPVGPGTANAAAPAAAKVLSHMMAVLLVF